MGARVEGGGREDLREERGERRMSRSVWAAYRPGGVRNEWKRRDRWPARCDCAGAWARWARWSGRDAVHTVQSWCPGQSSRSSRPDSGTTTAENSNSEARRQSHSSGDSHARGAFSKQRLVGDRHTGPFHVTRILSGRIASRRAWSSQSSPVQSQPVASHPLGGRVLIGQIRCDQGRPWIPWIPRRVLSKNERLGGCGSKPPPAVRPRRGTAFASSSRRTPPPSYARVPCPG